MRSLLRLTAELIGGRTRWTRLDAHGHLAARLTGDDSLHLVGTAAGPIGGDRIELELVVGAGASASIRSAAAMLVYPGLASADSEVAVSIRLGEGAQLDWAPEPAVVVQGAVHLNRMTVELAAGAQARLQEQVVLGRHGEAGGDWTGRLHVTREGRPVLRHSVTSGHLRLGGHRQMETLLDTEACGDDAHAETERDRVVLALASGGTLTTHLR